MAWDELEGHYLEHGGSNGTMFPLSNRRASVEEVSVVFNVRCFLCGMSPQIVLRVYIML